LSSKSFRGKKRHLILLARPEGLGIANEKYISNSSFENEYEGTTGLTALVMQTLKIRRNSSGHSEMFVKLVTITNHNSGNREMFVKLID